MTKSGISPVPARWQRVVAGLVGLSNLVNGGAMAFASSRWFAAAPGAADTGPFNVHFVTDVGLGYLASGIGLAIFASTGRHRELAFGATLFVAFHAIFHLILLALGHGSPGTDLAIALPALLALGMVAPRREVDR